MSKRIGQITNLQIFLVKKEPFEQILPFVCDFYDALRKIRNLNQISTTFDSLAIPSMVCVDGSMVCDGVRLVKMGGHLPFIITLKGSRQSPHHR